MKTPAPTSKNIISASESETINAARELSAQLRPGDVVFLRGNLGAGKSVFARALIRFMTRNDTLEVPSPTFTLVQTYDTPVSSLWHFDLYRLKNAEEIYELGWEEALQDITIVEWPERLGPLTPSQYLDISITALDNSPDHRQIEINRIGS